MGHALRVTEAGATPQKPWRTVRQRVGSLRGSLPPHPNLAASFLAFSSRSISVVFYKFASPPRRSESKRWVKRRG